MSNKLIIELDDAIPFGEMYRVGLCMGSMAHLRGGELTTPCDSPLRIAVSKATFMDTLSRDPRAIQFLSETAKISHPELAALAEKWTA